MNVRQVLPPDAIPSVDDPRFVETFEGDPDEEVIAVELAGEARAYPVRYLHYHEIVNDRFGGASGEHDGTGGPGNDGSEREAGRPVAVTWCPLCGSAVVYDRIVDGRTLEFGVSGKLADDDLVMYDRETGSEWKQSTGRAIAGPYEGRRLSVLPASVTTWRAFADAHPDGVVLAPPGGRSEASGPGDDPEPVDYEAAPYEAYFEGEGFGLGAHRGTGGREWGRDDIDPKTVVLGVERDGEALGFPLPVVRAAGGAVTASVGGTDVVVFATADGIHAFENPGYRFEAVDDDLTRFRADGTTWTGATGESADGRRLDRGAARRLFAFAWQDDHGPERFYGLD